jgi:putative tricarboxylic transport membrane protein
MTRDRAQVAIACALIAFAAFVFWQVAEIPADGGYSAVGPRFTPLLIGAGLLGLGVLLLGSALTTGWKGMEGAQPAERLHAPALLWIVGALVAHMLVIGVAGFTLASTMLFVMVARGFGSRRVAHDAIVGFVLAVVVFLFFTRVLSVSLPASALGAI